MRERCRNRTRLALACAGVALAMMAAPAPAQTVQKCIAVDGHVTLTSDACGAGERLAASYGAVPEPVVEAAARTRPVAESRPSRGGARSGPRRGGSATRAKRAPDRCQAARERRERTLQRVGLKRTFDLLRRLDDEVWQACR